MPNYSESLLPNSRAASEASATGGTAQTSFVCTIASAIATACNSSLYTISTSAVGQTSADLQYVLEALHTGGFEAAIVGSNLVVNWGS